MRDRRLLRLGVFILYVVGLCLGYFVFWEGRGVVIFVRFCGECFFYVFFCDSYYLFIVIFIYKEGLIFLVCGWFCGVILLVVFVAGLFRWCLLGILWCLEISYYRVYVFIFKLLGKKNVTWVFLICFFRIVSFFSENIYFSCFLNSIVKDLSYYF